MLNAEQKRAVEYSLGPLLVIAGAGSGKTRVVTERVVHLIEAGVPAHQILGVTFTNKAASEMSERVRSRTNARVLISTFHSLGARILRESAHVLGYPRGFSIYDEDDSQKVLRACLDSFSGLERKKCEKAFREMISHCKNALQEPSDVDPEEFYGDLMRKFPDVYAEYQARLRESNAFDFDDLLVVPVKLFREHPDVLKVYQSRWRYLLIDEYQDTNAAQYEMIRLLAGAECNVCAVGDPDQSIYSWRGANIQNILNFERDFPGAEVIRLEQNYRSRERILQAANALIENNVSRYEKRLWSARGEGESILLAEVHTEREEAEFVIREIDELIYGGTSLDQIAVLYRTNFQSRVLEDYFLHAGIPYSIIGGISFYQRLEIKDILAYLRMIQTSSDFIAFQRTLDLVKRGIGPAALDKLRLAAMQEGMPIFDYCRELVKEAPLKHPVRLNKTQKEGLSEYVELIESLRALEGSLRDIVLDVIHETGTMDLLKRDPETFEDRRDNVNELASKAAEWELMAEEPTLDHFLSELTLKTSAEQVDESAPRVKMMTLHNGKGLEFDYVFMVGLEEDLLPHVNSKDSTDDIEEERRLCYVGMTRARERLYFSRSRFRYMWGMLRQMSPSRFLHEIPEEYFTSPSS
ncbi:MAG: UvrD-helicase domain-containing protein [Chlamydiia bacterium]|nr:UvrD-helicase domain-containing protein [Chlamydiia bacterium]